MFNQIEMKENYYINCATYNKIKKWYNTINKINQLNDIFYTLILII